MSLKNKKDAGKRESPKVEYLPLKPENNIIEEYWVVKPFAKVVIASVPEMGDQRMYFVQEVQLTPEEEQAKRKLFDILSVELEPPESFEAEVREYVINEARRLAKKYRRTVRGLSEESWEKVMYYVERDLLGYGPIDVLMRDPRLEDISCDGVDRAVHVWHRDYESIPTNIVFRDRSYLREFVVKLAHMAGKHISTAFPIVDAMLPGRHRLAATFGEEVSPRGSTFTIRKFRQKPFSVVELIANGHTDLWTAAYIWLMLENKMSMMIMGSTAAGKTTALNAYANFFKPGMKIVTVEETPELNLSHENWVQLVSREAYGLGESKGKEITLYDLVKLSLRYRPDYIIVGEVRGEEAFVLFQAVATGHGGMCTIHAESINKCVQRLTSPPMNVSPAYISSMNIMILIDRVRLPGGKIGRRLRYLWEVEDFNKYRLIVKWDPRKDVHEQVAKSVLLQRIAEREGKSIEELEEEIERRIAVLRWMLEKGIKDFREVSNIINQYYLFPEETYEKAIMELHTIEISLEKEDISKILYSLRGRHDIVFHPSSNPQYKNKRSVE